MLYDGFEFEITPVKSKYQAMLVNSFNMPISEKDFGLFDSYEEAVVHVQEWADTENENMLMYIKLSNTKS